MKKIIFASLLSALAFSANADQLLVTQNGSIAAPAADGNKSLQVSAKSQVSVDYISDGEAVAFQAKIKLPEGVDKSKVDLSSCLSELPSTHTGTCQFVKGDILVLVFDDKNTPLPSGVVAIGKINVPAMKGTVQVTEVLAGNDKAEDLKATSQVEVF